MVCRSTPNLIFWTVAQTGKITPLVSGPPGCGKSRTIEAFARAMNRQCYALIGSLREPADVGGYPYPVPGEQPYMAVMPPKWAQDCQHGQWVLFLDELTTCPPAVQAALLGVIAENRVGDAVLPDTVWKLAACNPPDCAANGSELEPPLANRLCHLTWETDVEAWQRGMSNALGFPQRSFAPLPVDWEKCIGRNTALVPFSAGPTFAEACHERLAWIWEQEAGPGVPMPLGMEQMGWRKDNYSMRRAMTALGAALELRCGEGVAA